MIRALVYFRTRSPIGHHSSLLSFFLFCFFTKGRGEVVVAKSFQLLRNRAYHTYIS